MSTTPSTPRSPGGKQPIAREDVTSDARELVQSTPPAKLPAGPAPRTESSPLAAPSRGKRRLWQRGWFWLSALGLALLAALAWWLSRPRETEPRYVSVAVRRGDLQAEVVATGTLQPLDQVDVGAEISGRVVSVNADYNDQVSEGQVLAQLDRQQWQAAVRQASAQLAANRAALTGARAAREEADLTLQRTELLAAEALATSQQLETARATAQRMRANVELAAAQVALAEAALSSARASLEKTTIRSPMTGIVLSRSVEPGQTVAATLQSPVLFVLARDLTRMELHVQVDEADIGQIEPGQSASFTVDTYPGRRFPARLTSVHNIATTQNNVVTYEARLQVANGDLALRPGMTATVNIITAERSGALLLPNAALRFTPPALLERNARGPRMPLFGRRSSGGDRPAPVPGEAGPVVWVAVDGQPEPRSVELGLTDGEWTELRGGSLADGDGVLTDVMTGVP